MIQLKNLERSYKTAAGETWVLRRIDLTIPEGAFLTIMGPSGAGKSSLLNALALPELFKLPQGAYGDRCLGHGRIGARLRILT